MSLFSDEFFRASSGMSRAKKENGGNIFIIIISSVLLTDLFFAVSCNVLDESDVQSFVHFQLTHAATVR